jgi:hypothetical protein
MSDARHDQKSAQHTGRIRTRWPTWPALLIDAINAAVKASDPMVSVRRITTMLLAE